MSQQCWRCSVNIAPEDLVCCPTCIIHKTLSEKSYYCSEKCFKEGWKRHSKLHPTPPLSSVPSGAGAPADQPSAPDTSLTVEDHVEIPALESLYSACDYLISEEAEVNDWMRAVISQGEAHPLFKEGMRILRIVNTNLEVKCFKEFIAEHEAGDTKSNEVLAIAHLFLSRGSHTNSEAIVNSKAALKYLSSMPDTHRSSRLLYAGLLVELVVQQWYEAPAEALKNVSRALTILFKHLPRDHVAISVAAFVAASLHWEMKRPKLCEDFVRIGLGDMRNESYYAVSWMYPCLLNLLANALCGQAKYDDAIVAVEQSIGLSADHGDPYLSGGAHMMRGIIMLERKDTVSAIASFRTAVALAPNVPAVGPFNHFMGDVHLNARLGLAVGLMLSRDQFGAMAVVRDGLQAATVREQHVKYMFAMFVAFLQLNDAMSALEVLCVLLGVGVLWREGSSAMADIACEVRAFMEPLTAAAMDMSLGVAGACVPVTVTAIAFKILLKFVHAMMY